MAAPEETDRPRFVTGARSAPTPQMTLRKDGKTLAFNRAAFVALGRPEYVELLFDWERREIAVRPVSTETAHSFVVSKYRGTAIWYVGAVSLSRAYGLVAPEARRLDARLEEGLLVVDVRDLG